MPLFPNNFESFGLDIGDHTLKAVYVKKSGSSPIIFSRNIVDLDPDALIHGQINNQDKLIAAIKKLLSGMSPHRVNTPYVHACLPEVQTFIKLIKVKNDDKTPLKNSLLKELPNHIPLDA